MIVPPNMCHADETLIEMVIDAGYLHHGPTKLNLMEDEKCHQNTSLLFARQEVVGIGTGSALCDRAWYNHSWGIGRGGETIETTNIIRERYFGVVLFGLSAKSFCELNCIVDGKVRTPSFRYRLTTQRNMRE